MRRKIAGAVVGAALLVGGLGSGASAQTAPNLANFTNRISAAQISQIQNAIRRLDTAQLVGIVNQAVATNPARLQPVKDMICANAPRLLLRAPIRVRPQATALLNQLCAPPAPEPPAEG
jgi:hypothetical protein